MNLVGVRRLGRIQVCVSAASAFLASLGFAGCTIDNPGITPPSGVVNFPIALELSPDSDSDGKPDFLYVANANFDLRYNAGSVQVYSLGKLQDAIDTASCRAAIDDAGVLQPDAEAPTDASLDAADAELGDAGLADAEPADAAIDAALQRVYPYASASDAGELSEAGISKWRAALCDERDGNANGKQACCFREQAELDALRTGEVQIDSFASGLALGPDGNKLYVPVRSKTRLLYLDTGSDGDLSCGSLYHCRRGPAFEAEARTGDVDFPTHPAAVVTGRLSEIFSGDQADLAKIEMSPSTGFVATTHDDGSLSLFTIDENTGAPFLENVLTTGIRRTVGLSKDPGSHLFYLASAESSEIARVSLNTRCEGGRGPDGDCVNGGLHLQLERASSVAIGDVSQNIDVRDVLVDPRPVVAGEPVRLYALLRGRSSTSSVTTLNSILFLEAPARTADGSAVRVAAVKRLGEGLNRLVQADIGGRHLLFASGYRQRVISIIDADSRNLVATVGEFSGPYDLRVDAARQLMYVADFGASVVRIVDLSGLADPTRPRPRIVGTLGSPYFSGSIQ